MLKPSNSDDPDTKSDAWPRTYAIVSTCMEAQMYLPDFVLDRYFHYLKYLIGAATKSRWKVGGWLIESVQMIMLMMIKFFNHS